MQSLTQNLIRSSGIGAIFTAAAAAARQKLTPKRKAKGEGGLDWPGAFLGQHTNPAGNARRQLKKQVGARQLRRDTRHSYAMRGGW